jgi:phosphate transport system substrate-binding protein
MLRRIGLLLLLGHLGFGVADTGTAAESVRLNGAAAIAAALIKVKGELETTAQVPVTILSKNAGKGLQDLCAGTCDIAMVTGSLEKAAAGANAEQAGSVDLTPLKAVATGQDRVVFVVHPNNPVDSLKMEQIKDIYTGSTHNWKEVGGSDAVMMIYTLGARNGPRIAMDDNVFKNTPLTTKAILRENPRDICTIVSQVPNSIAFLGESSLNPGVKVLKTDKEIVMPFFLVTKGDPTPFQTKVIDAVKILLAKTAKTQP